jgi:hypothetical protein
MKQFILDLLNFALEFWNGKFQEIMNLITESPQEFKGGGIWRIILTVHEAVKAIGLGLLVLFFVVGVMKTLGSFAELKRPEIAVKLFIRFAIAKTVVTRGLELMEKLIEIMQGLVSRIWTVGTYTLVQVTLSDGSKVMVPVIDNTGTAISTTLPQTLIDAVNKLSFFDSIVMVLIALLAMLAIIAMSFVLVLTVYGRFFKIYLYTAIAPVPLAAFAGEPSQNMGKAFLKSYAGICLQGAIIVVSCIIFNAFANAPPTPIEEDLTVMFKVLTYTAGVIFNMLILVGTIKAADNIVREVMSL